MTLIGILSLGAEPYALAGSVQPASGILLAVAGAIVTFAGLSWSIPKGVIRGREVLGGVFYSVGFLTILVLVIDSIFRGNLSATEGRLLIEIPLLLVGALLTGLGLKLFLLPEKRDASLKVLGSA